MFNMQNKFKSPVRVLVLFLLVNCMNPGVYGNPLDLDLDQDQRSSLSHTFAALAGVALQKKMDLKTPILYHQTKYDTYEQEKVAALTALKTLPANTEECQTKQREYERACRNFHVHALALVELKKRKQQAKQDLRILSAADQMLEAWRLLAITQISEREYKPYYRGCNPPSDSPVSLLRQALSMHTLQLHNFLETLSPAPEAHSDNYIYPDRMIIEDRLQPFYAHIGGIENLEETEKKMTQWFAWFPVWYQQFEANQQPLLEQLMSLLEEERVTSVPTPDTTANTIGERLHNKITALGDQILSPEQKKHFEEVMKFIEAIKRTQMC